MTLHCEATALRSAKPVEIALNEHTEDGRATVEWEFTAPARAILQRSDYYARLDRVALLAFRSKYATTLYEMGSLLVGGRNPTWSGTVDELLERLGGIVQLDADFFRFPSSGADAWEMQNL